MRSFDARIPGGFAKGEATQRRSWMARSSPSEKSRPASARSLRRCETLSAPYDREQGMEDRRASPPLTSTDRRTDMRLTAGFWRLGAGLLLAGIGVLVSVLMAAPSFATVGTVLCIKPGSAVLAATN